MKNIKTKIFAFIATTSMLSISCSEKKLKQDEIVKLNVEDYLQSQMNDPESYEFVKLELIDSISFSNNIEYRKESFQRNLKYNKDDLERHERYKTDIPSMYSEEKIEEINEKITKNEKILTKIDSIETNLGNRINETASYTYIYSFRGNNKMGAKILKEYIVQTNPAPNFEIINMTDKKDKIYLNPNDFPGYREMISKMLLD